MDDDLAPGQERIYVRLSSPWEGWPVEAYPDSPGARALEQVHDLVIEVPLVPIPEVRRYEVLTIHRIWSVDGTVRATESLEWVHVLPDEDKPPECDGGGPWATEDAYTLRLYVKVSGWVHGQVRALFDERAAPVDRDPVASVVAAWRERGIPAWALDPRRPYFGNLPEDLQELGREVGPGS